MPFDRKFSSSALRRQFADVSTKNGDAAEEERGREIQWRSRSVGHDLSVFGGT